MYIYIYVHKAAVALPQRSTQMRPESALTETAGARSNHVTWTVHRPIRQGLLFWLFKGFKGDIDIDIDVEVEHLVSAGRKSAMGY